MANPTLPNVSPAEQDLLYSKLNAYNEGRASYKEAGAYLVVLPRPDHPAYSLWIYSPLPERQAIFYLCELSADINESLRMASTLCFYSSRRLLIVEYNAKRMQSRGDDLVGFGKYQGHFLHEVLRIDPAYVTWIAYKFQPRIPKQERFRQIARIYHSVYTDFQRRKTHLKNDGRFLGKPGDKVEGLTLVLTQVRVEDNPYKTDIRNGQPRFYVRQAIKANDPAGNSVSFRINARTPSNSSCTLPALEHAFRPGETIKIKSARIDRTYTAGGTKYTRLTHLRLESPE